MATKRVSDDDVPVALPSLAELPPLERDEFEIPIFDRPSSFSIGDEDAARPSLDESDAVEGPAVDDVIDAFADEAGAPDDDLFDESFDGGIDEAPDAGALGDDDDGLGNDASDLDESLLTNERPDDGADGVDADVVAVDEPVGMAEEEVDEGEGDEPIVLPPLPRIDP